jgi:hypothetical protein
MRSKEPAGKLTMRTSLRGVSTRLVEEAGLEVDCDH